MFKLKNERWMDPKLFHRIRK